MGRLTAGCPEGGVRGLGRPARDSAEAIRAGRSQRRHSSGESGETRWSEGRQEVGVREVPAAEMTRSKCRGPLR